MPFDSATAMTNPVTGRPWGRHDARILAARGYGSLASPEPGARVYPVFCREQLASYCEAPDWDAPAEPETRVGLLTFLVRHGGVQDQRGDLRSMDAHRRRVGLVRVNGGMTLDHARASLVKPLLNYPCVSGNSGFGPLGGWLTLGMLDSP